MIKRAIRSVIGKAGYVIVPKADEPFTVDFDEATRETIRAVSPYTMTGPERVAALCNAVNYIAENRIPGDIVECGVWKGGSMMAVARTLQAQGDIRNLYLFDTFEGMPAPTGVDVDFRGTKAHAKLAQSDKATAWVWAYSPFGEVKTNMQSTGYPDAHVCYVRGKVEDTVPAHAPKHIALLRLDTDWYESTLHEMEHLYHRLVSGGVLILDDYGHWQGARRAVDEYLAKHKPRLLLQRIDYSGRIAVKP